MREMLNNILQYLKVGMWQTQREDVSPLLFVLLTVLRKLVLTIRFFTTRSIMDMASALTYSTLLAIVPILQWCSPLLADLVFPNTLRCGLEKLYPVSHRRQMRL